MRHHALAIAGLAVLGAMASGCGSVSGGGDTSKFEGTWRYDSGTVVGTCLTTSASDDLTGDTVTLAKGTSSDLVLTVSPTCQIKFGVSGTKATASPGQICSIEVATVGSVSVAVDSWTLETTDGVMMTGALAGESQVPFMGVTVTCTVTGTGMLTKQ